MIYIYAPLGSRCHEWSKLRLQSGLCCQGLQASGFVIIGDSKPKRMIFQVSPPLRQILLPCFFTQFFRGLSLQLMVNCKCWSSESETNSPDSILHFGWEPYPAFGAFAFFGFFGWPSPVFPLGNWFPPAVKWACFPVRLSAKLCRAALLACTLPETPIPSYRTFDRSPESRGVGSCVHYHGG